MEQKIEEYLKKHIPFSNSLDFEVLAYDEQTIRMKAPLQPNLNHQLTAFGGSVCTLAILASWTLLNFAMREVITPSQLVIQGSDMKFLKPIRSEFEAISSLPSSQKYYYFLESIQKHKKGRITLQAEVRAEGILAATHQGTYVGFAEQA